MLSWHLPKHTHAKKEVIRESVFVNAAVSGNHGVTTYVRLPNQASSGTRLIMVVSKGKYEDTRKWTRQMWRV